MHNLSTTCGLLASKRVVGLDSHLVPESFPLLPRQICIRHVPNQDPERLIEKIRAHAAHEFAKLRARGNRLDVKVQHVGDWWLADPTNVFYRTAERAIGRQWGVRPMYVREGGTMPVVPFLEKALEAPALHLPISQASDHTALLVRGGEYQFVFLFCEVFEESGQ